MAIIGIDLGTTNSLCTTWKDGKCVFIPNSFGEYLTPSAVSIDDNGEIIVGKIAKERLISHPKLTVSSFKQYMGLDKKFSLGKKAFYPEDLSSLILRQLKKDAETFLGEPVTEAIISVPAYFNNNQRSATKLAGELAGLYVERIINEPSAASLAYQQILDTQNGIYMVFDFGGGTLDVSIVEIFENIVDIISVSGNNHLGGDDINNAIVNTFYEKHPKLEKTLSLNEKASLYKLAEQCKTALSSSDHVVMTWKHKDASYELFLNNKVLIDICAPILAKIKDVLKQTLKDSHKHVSAIDQIILVGGSSKMPLIHDYITHLTGKTPSLAIDPDKAVAYGVCVVTGIKNREDSIKDTVMTDICPFSLGIDTYNVQNRTPDVFFPIIERNTYLPVSRNNIFSTIHDNQKEIYFKIYQGESRIASQNLLLGELKISVPPAKMGQVGVNVTFSYDINGILEVEAVCLENNETVKKLIVTNKNLSETEIEKRRVELEKLKMVSQENSDNKLLIARAERLYEENTDEIRETINTYLQAFTTTIQESKHITEIKKAQMYFNEFLNQIDQIDLGLNEEDF